MRCLSFFINKKMLGKKLCVGTCLKCLTVATPLTMTKDKVTALSSLFRYNKTIDYYIRSQYQDMRTSRLVTLCDLECQVSRSSYPGIDFLGSN